MYQDPSIAIAPGEVVRFSDQFSPRMLFTHLKVTVVLTDRRVIVRRPNTLFGVFPKGYYEQTSPLRHISEVNAGESFSTRQIVYGVGAILIGLTSLTGSLLGVLGILIGLVLIGVGAVLLMNAHSTGIGFRNHGAGLLFAAAGKSERTRVEEAKNAINSSLFANGVDLEPAAPPAPNTAPSATPTPTPTPTPTSPVREFTAAQASNPSTPQSVLSQIAERDPSLRPLVAANLNAYPGLLDWLGSLGDPAVDRALSTRTSSIGY